MNCFRSSGSHLLCVALLLLSPAPLAAQQATTADPTSATKVPAAEEISLSKTQATWDAIEADASVETAIKDLLRPKFKLAMEDLQKAGEYRTASEGFRRAIESAPVEAVKSRDELSVLSAGEPLSQVEVESKSTVELQRELAAQDAALQTLADELEKVKSELVSMRERRPTEISARTPAVETQLSQTQSELQSSNLSQDATSLGRVADRTVLLARESRLSAELEMLKQERLSLPAREDLLEARSDLLTQRVSNASIAIAALKQQVQDRLQREAKEVGSVIDSTKESIPKTDVAALRLADEVSKLAGQFDDLVSQNAMISSAQDETSYRLKRLNEEYQRLSRELDVEDAGPTMAQMAFDLQDRLLDPNIYAVVTDESIASPDALRLSSIRIDQQLRDQESTEEQFSRRNSQAIDQLLKTRSDLLEKLKTQYTRLIPARVALEVSRNDLQTRNNEVHEAISEQMVWIRSSPPLRVHDIMNLPAGIGWLFSVEHWREFCRAVEYRFQRQPIPFISVLSLVVILLATRPRMIRALEATGQGIRRVSTDRYWLTCEALFWTVLLSAPLVVLLGFLAWTFAAAPEQTSWIRGLADGTPSEARIVFMLAFIAELCRPNGLGNAHFAWQQPTLDAVRSALFRIGIVYVPAGLIVTSTLYGDASRYADGVGRISLMLSKLWIFGLLWQQFGGSNGLVARLIENQPHRLLTRTRLIWYPLLLLVPIFFLILAARGYVIASIELSKGFAQTLGTIFLGEVAYWMVLRWFSLKARKLAVAERMDRLRAARQAATTESAEESGEVIAVSAEDDQMLDLETIGLQTRRMVRSLISVAIALTIVYLWSSNFPLAPILSAVEIPFTDGVDLFELTQALLLLGITWVIVKNIPGVLELSVLRASEFDTGTRYAITTLSRYAIAAIGAAAIFNVLNFDWTKFGWMAAALGVGLGFGLQEVITNFVCGLILLFERPVRLGDVVTIQGVTGIVTKIRMRATTITNWDRQEFVVPNKSLITDTILNWTLSASISRIVINVGVAYGSDTEQARQILLDVAGAHPIVMSEPQPLATFEEFADSSLTLCLRCFVPDLDNRLKTISELHTEIDHRFADAGIEIAFPQQDIHIRSGLDAIQKPKRAKSPKASVNNR